MAGDIIPKEQGDYREWLQNLFNEIETEGPKFGLNASQILQVKDPVQAMLDAIDAETAAESALAAARQNRITKRTETNKMLRDMISGWKRTAGFLPEHAQKLRLVSTTPSLDADNYKPEFKVRIVAGEIRIDWKKKGADAVYIYSRLRGVATWTRIGMDTSSPYIDGRPLAQANVPETREYMLRGVVKDEEIGLDSDVLSITWSGQ